MSFCVERGIVFAAERQMGNRSVSIYGALKEKGGLGYSHLTTTITVHKDEPNNPNIAEPMLVLDNKDAESLMNALWDAGIRPHNGAGSSAEVEAIKNHLKDMQRLVFEKNSPAEIASGVKMAMNKFSSKVIGWQE